MNTPLDSLLTQLEHLSADAVKITDPSVNEVVDSIAALGKIKERGDLIEQLNTELKSATDPLSYMDFNRLVLIHHQGSQAEQNLRLTRNQLAGQLLATAHERAYLDCLTVGIEAPRTNRLTNRV